jgi:thioredoxin reductase
MSVERHGERAGGDGDPVDVCVVGAGVAGLTCGCYTARAGLSTRLLDGGDSILRRNAHLENVPGFPLGVNARTFLELAREGAERAGAVVREGRAVDLRPGAPAQVTLADGTDVLARRVVVASWSDAGYLPSTVETVTRGTKTYVEADENGHTSVEGVYATGRIAGRPHQTVVAAGHGAEVGLSVVEDSDVPYYHDWVVPKGYFTDRGRTVPPGCEEIGPEEWERRERRAMERMRAAFAAPHPDDQPTHPSLEGEDG